MCCGTPLRTPSVSACALHWWTRCRRCLTLTLHRWVYLMNCPYLEVAGLAALLFQLLAMTGFCFQTC